MATRLLKSTKMSTIQKAEREVIVDTNGIKDLNYVEVTGTILSLELDSLSEKVVGPKYKGNVEQLHEELIICNSFNTMTIKDSCKKSGNMALTAFINRSKMVFIVQPSLIATAFEGTLQENFKLTKSVLKYDKSSYKVNKDRQR